MPKRTFHPHKALLVRRGIAQSDVATEAGVRPATVWKVLNGLATSAKVNAAIVRLLRGT